MTVVTVNPAVSLPDGPRLTCDHYHGIGPIHHFRDTTQMVPVGPFSFLKGDTTINLSEAYTKIQLFADILPPNAGNRPGDVIKPTHITIHETDNPSKGADARAHARYLKGPDARKRNVSWHITVDDQRAIKHLPLLEKGWHAGSAEGNRQSIGIEICVNEGADFAAAKDRAALLTAVICRTNKIPLENVVPHKAWTQKTCPRRILASTTGFAGFRALVRRYMDELEKP